MFSVFASRRHAYYNNQLLKLGNQQQFIKSAYNLMHINNYFPLQRGAWQTMLKNEQAKVTKQIAQYNQKADNYSDLSSISWGVGLFGVMSLFQ
jgi:hypothetical protein